MNELKVICYTAAVRPEGIADAINESKARGSALIVLCNEALSRAKREEILKYLKENNARENPFLLIDQTLTFYLGLCPRDTRLKSLLHCTLPYTFYNPFGRDPLAPEMFVTREELLRLQKIEEPTPLVYGGRQLGKTALLRRACEMEDAEKERSYAVYVSVQPANGEGPKEVFVKKLSETLAERGLISKRIYKDNQEICEALRKRFDASSDTIRLYVDEMDEYFRIVAQTESTDLLVPFVDLRRKHPTRLKFVFAGLHHVARQPSK